MPARTFYGRRPNEADIPEASQQQDMVTQGSPIPDQDETLPQATPETSAIDGMHDVNGGSGIVISNEPMTNGTGTMRQKVIGENEIHEANSILQKYKAGKARLENRVQQDELFWELRQWEAIGRKNSKKENEKNSQTVKSTSAWLFSSIVSKHSDAMDNYPTALVLPRERSDEQSADILKSVLPVILKYNHFNKTYRDNWWDKLVHGTGIYGVFWDSTKENGLGDISIKSIDIMKLFWEPGITNIQDSRNLFICELVDADLLKQMYPEHADRIKGSKGGLNISEYLYDESIDTTDKAVVVDWYYKVHDPSGRTVLHYVKYVDDEVLYASENDPELAERGFYDHGLYPIVMDTLFPVKGTPAGFGYVSVGRDPQIYIDALSSNILQTSMMGSKKRFLVAGNSDINEEEFADWSKPFVHATGSLGEDRIKEIEIQPVAPAYINVLQMKIEEMKETSSNRDVSNGSSGAGITSGAAISALQEAGNKDSRNMISNTYEAFSEICHIVIELMRQFYDEQRAFRVVGANDGEFEYMNVDNSQLRDQPIINPANGQPMMSNTGEMLFRKPVFDVEVQAQKRNPFSTLEANQRATELYGLGFFNPERAQEALGALEMMEFEGKDKVLDTVKQGQTLLNIVEQQSQKLSTYEAILVELGILQPQPDGPAPQQGGPSPSPQPQQVKSKVNNAAGVPRTPYAQRLAERSGANMNVQNEAANPIRR